MSKQNIREKKPFDTTAVINNEFCAIFALVNRLTASLDNSINGKERSVLVNELLQLNFSNLSEPVVSSMLLSYRSKTISVYDSGS